MDRQKGTIEKCVSDCVRVSDCQRSFLYVFQTVSTVLHTCFRLSAQCCVRVSDCQHSVVYVFQTVSMM